MAALLLVDDDEDLTDTLQELLELNSHQVDVARDGRTALQHCSSRIYDLLLLDWQLPDMDGLTICRTFRSEGNIVPVVLITGMRDGASKIAGKDAGATELLIKPFTIDRFLDCVQAMLKKHSQP